MTIPLSDTTPALLDAEQVEGHPHGATPHQRLLTVTLASVGVLGLAALCQIAWARSLAVRDVGFINYGLALAQWLVLIGDFGTGRLLARDVALHPPTTLRRVRDSVLLRLGASLSAVVAAIVYFVVSHQSAGDYIPYLLMTAVLVFDVRPALDGLGAAHLETLLRAARGALVLLLTLLGVVLSAITGRLVSWVILVAAVLYVMTCWLILLRRASRTSTAIPDLSWRTMTARHLPIAVAALCVQAYTGLAPLMLEWMHSLEVVGIFAPAMLLANAGLVATSTPLRTFYPTLMRGIQRQEIAKELRKIAVWGAAITLGLLVVSAPVVHGVFGPNYGASVAALRWMAPMCVIVAVGSLFGHSLLAHGREGAFLGHVALGAFVNILVLTLLAPRYPIVGAAVAVLSAQLAVAAAAIWLSGRLGYRLFANIGGPLLLAVATTVLTLVPATSNIGTAVALAGVALFAAMYGKEAITVFMGR